MRHNKTGKNPNKELDVIWIKSNFAIMNTKYNIVYLIIFIAMNKHRDCICISNILKFEFYEITCMLFLKSRLKKKYIL